MLVNGLKGRRGVRESEDDLEVWGLKPGWMVR